MSTPLIVISDLHVGDPETPELEDFTEDERFTHLLLEVVPQRIGERATLVIAGDFIDFPQVLPQAARFDLGARVGASQDESAAKMRRVLDGHPSVFDAMREFIARGNRIVVLPGNHDVDLHWPDVLALLRGAVRATPGELVFVKDGELRSNRVHIEHGNQQSFDNFFKYWSRPIVHASDGERLERPWGTFFMDLVYNDLETMYPFINKVYPHSALAWIALASLRDDENVSIEVLARLAAFFVSHGKAMAVRHLLGGDAAPSDHAMTSEALASILGDPTASGRSQRIAERATELLRVESGNGAPDARAGTAVTGLLGQSDARGLRRRATQLHQSGHVDLVVFGHTHHAIDGNAEPSPYGDARRTFNTGSWMPHIPIEPDEKLHWRDLRDRPMSHAIKYLVVDPARSLAWLEDL